MIIKVQNIREQKSSETWLANTKSERRQTEEATYMYVRLL